VRPLLEQPFDAAAITAIKNMVAVHYTMLDRPFVRAAVPPQDVTNGIVQVVVVESRLGVLKTEGNRWFSDSAITGPVPLRPGDPIDTARLDAAVRWINQNPYRHVAPVASAGDAPGTTDVTMQVEDRIPLSASIGAGNSGNASTGEFQASTGVEWGNAFGRGDTLNFHLLAGESFSQLRQYSGAYTLNLPWRDQLSISGSYARTQPPATSDVDTIGTVATLGAHYGWRSRGGGKVTQRMSAGFDWKRTNNDLLFGGSSVFASAATIEQFVGDYDAGFRSRAGLTNAGVTAVFSPGGLSEGNSDETFDTQRQGATARYALVRANVSHAVPLPARFVWDTRVIAQISNAKLLSLEQTTLGGFGSVRGFLTSTATRDSGVILNTELRIAPFSVVSRENGSSWRDELVGFVFADYAQGVQHDDVDPARVRLASAGPGLRYRLGRRGSVQLSYGRVIQAHGLSTHPSGRVDVQVQALF
jgi:hemolysin activation/secretion protein